MSGFWTNSAAFRSALPPQARPDAWPDPNRTL